ncbi:hypothetical protein C499_12725 [Halogeometricum borinquense DSM 11551]|uniref:Uncharacterized protein n=3 Tax=Halogeometricum borinquense TaxID=60847 RepID=E4NWL7_HALBP|nr:hypothetical protein Hbor_37310 [Halogeometricum borinquense DSM 11551]ELY25989.1 hypothetical protein C499_12725 [Halogeometricum borinquense DSM 11551]RYJ19475.1 hypothetical protein ELS19_00255 [Halogeometricum borinquense]
MVFVMQADLTDDLEADVWSLFESGVLSEEVTRHLLGDRSFEAWAEKRRMPQDLFWGDANQFFG